MSVGVDRRTREFKKLKSRSSGRCGYCGCALPDGAPPVDHMVPKRLGGESDESNLIICCLSCIRSKRGRDIEDYRDSLAIKRSPLNGIINSSQYSKLMEIGVDLSHLVDCVEFFFESEGTRIAFEDCHASEASK